MNTSFSVEHEWLKDDVGMETHDAESALVSIWLNGLCVTELEDRSSDITRTRRSARLSVVRMARWFAGNWWRLRWEPEERQASLDWQMSHNLAAAGGGYLWPSLTLSSDGETILAVAKSGDPNGTEPIRYLQDYSGVIPAVDFETVIDDFVATVIDGLSTEVRRNTDLIDLWNEVNCERAELELHDVRKLEARLGFDPGEAPGALITSLLDQRKIYGADAVQELAVASKERAVDHLESLGAEVRLSGESAQLPDCNTIREQYQLQTISLDAPWKRGEQAARIARNAWRLPPGPVQNNTMVELFGVNLDEHQSDLPLSAGLRDRAGDGLHIALHQRYLTGRRFTLARLVADQVATPTDERLLPATSSRTSRQKFQRAFARELLCPIGDLQDFLGTETPTDDDIDAAAAHFQVSDRVVAFALVNNGVIQREAMGEWAV